METTEKKKRWIIGGVHAGSANNRAKWEEVERTIEDIDENYIIPKILYIDINAQVTSEKYL